MTIAERESALLAIADVELRSRLREEFAEQYYSVETRQQIVTRDFNASTDDIETRQSAKRYDEFEDWNRLHHSSNVIERFGSYTMRHTFDDPMVKYLHSSLRILLRTRYWDDKTKDLIRAGWFSTAVLKRHRPSHGLLELDPIWDEIQTYLYFVHGYMVNDELDDYEWDESTQELTLK